MDNVLSVSEFVALVNQTLEYAYPIVRVEGEIQEYRVSRGKWVYFNLVDGTSSVRVFSSVYQIRGVYEDGMRVVVKATPRLHNLYGFSLNLQTISSSGEGSIKRAYELLKKKLEGEGLFSPERKRPLPEFPAAVGLVTSSQAAAYSDFLTLLDQRWGGVLVQLIDVKVQGQDAPTQIKNAINHFSAAAQVDVIVVTRGGGGAEDLMAFSSEEVVRAVAASRVPVVVGVGHERDVSLADLASDARATTPTNAAQIIVPDKQVVSERLHEDAQKLKTALLEKILDAEQYIHNFTAMLDANLTTLETSVTSLQVGLQERARQALQEIEHVITMRFQKLELMNPRLIMKRGFSVVSRGDGSIVSSSSQLQKNDKIMIRFNKGSVDATVGDTND